MSNYRRLISYLYAYEGGTKGKNIGFVKLEARNGQCKINISVKKVYAGSNDIGVYLLTGKQEIKIGTIFIRGGAGEFRTAVLVNNVENSGCSMEDCYGLSIHDVESDWQSYTTIWEDAVTHAAEVELADSSSKEKTLEEKEAQEEKQRKEIVDEIHKEFEITKEEAQQLGAGEIEVAETEAEAEAEAEAEVEVEAEALCKVKTSVEVEERVKVGGSNTSQIKARIQQPRWGSQIGRPGVAKDLEAAQIFPLGNHGELEQLEQEEQEEYNPEKRWEQFRKMHAKIKAFDYEHGCEILTIKPQDIGLLPREEWSYGNNSFVLHAYYNYRYLILVKLNNPDGTPRYLLGVPGHYYSNEKYMASMFGFPNFVLSKTQPMEDGRFGYWYADINMGNQ